MELKREEVEKVARLARIELTEEEKTRFAVQLGKVLTYMEELNRVDTSGVEPTSQVPGRAGEFRADEPRVFEGIERILANAPELEEGYFKVRKVIE